MSFLENEIIDKSNDNIHEAIFSSSPIAIELYDSNGKLFKVNKACLDLFGVDDFKVVKGFNLFKDPNIPKKLLKKLKRGEPVKYEIPFSFDLVKKLNLYKTKKTGFIDLDVIIIPLYLKESNSISHYLVQIQDITDRKKSEKDSRISEEKFRELLNNMSSGVAVYEATNDGKDFIFKEFNLAGEQIDNIKKEDIMGKSVLKVFPNVRKFGLFDVFKRVWKTGKPEHHPIALYEDQRIKGWRNNYVYKLSTGEIVAIYDDITERMIALKKLEESDEKLRRLNENLEKKVKQRTIELKNSEKEYREAYEKSNFYKDLFAHDISNILQVMNSSAELIQHYLKDPRKDVDMQQVIDMIKKQVMRGKMIVYNVHRLSELEEINQSLKKTEILEFLKQILTLIKNTQKEKEINARIEASNETYFILANSLLKDLFENLLINAIKYNENPIIEILIKISKIKKNSQNFIKMEFMDNGIGIQPDRKEIIFQRGNREFKGTKGMGLGLSLVKKIVENYNGQIWVEDKIKGDYAKGSNFIITLPQVN